MMILLYLLGLFVAFGCCAETFQPHTQCRTHASAAMVGSDGILPDTESQRPLFAVTGCLYRKRYERDSQGERGRRATHKRTTSCVFMSHAVEEAAEHAHEEVQESFDQIKSFDLHDLLNADEWEMHRQLANFDVAHRVEEDVKKTMNAYEQDAKQEKGADLHLEEQRVKNHGSEGSYDQIHPSTDDARKFKRHPIFDVE
uniref:Uncharacterized protein n=1 Tax=Amphora coffeiformis TaxID=265554 RepID=A0A7S3L955_9STRA|mmetsp:Transcript_6771/g.13007  ORF Transcript_6771/g.13007 Transcript_6771/m.13007 type:complete len:199 (+) Transcript_6771:114-710(+)|eukprot:scaffold1564_cov174-Amphora_coffeaeformis.AAC.2